MNRIVDIAKIDYHILWEEKVAIDIYRISDKWYLKHSAHFAIQDSVVETRREYADDIDMYEIVMDAIEFFVNKGTDKSDTGRIDRLICEIDEEDIARIAINIVRSDRNFVKAHFAIDTRVSEVYENENMMTLIDALKKANKEGLIMKYKENIIEISPSV